MAKYDLTYDIGHGTDTWENGGGKGVRKNGKVYEEHTANSDVGERVIKILRDHGLRVHVPQKPMSKEVSLSKRIAEANRLGVKLYWSTHFNAGVSSASGVCAFYWHTSSKSRKLAEAYAKNAKAMGFKTHGNGTHASKRGSWTELAVCRDTKMPAVLTENGFMTNSKDFEGIFGKNKNKYRQKVAELQAKTILEDFFGIKYDSKRTKVRNGGRTPEDRLGEVRLKQAMNYRAKPSLNAKVLRVLPKGHECHFYEEKGHWLRLGVGWVSNAGGKYVEITKRYNKKPKEPKKKIYRVIVDGEQVGAYSKDSNILKQAEKAIKAGKDNILIEEV